MLEVKEKADLITKTSEIKLNSWNWIMILCAVIDMSLQSQGQLALIKFKFYIGILRSKK